MALGIGLNCCCPQETCTELTLCGTADSIITNSDLSAYSIGDVLRRDVSEGGGCWEKTNTDVTCTDPETFTVAEDDGLYTGETACDDCLAACAELCADAIDFPSSPATTEVCVAYTEPLVYPDVWGRVVYFQSTDCGSFESDLTTDEVIFNLGDFSVTSNILNPYALTIPFSIRAYVDSGEWWLELTLNGVTHAKRANTNFGASTFYVVWTYAEAEDFFDGLTGACPLVEEEANVVVEFLLPPCP